MCAHSADEDDRTTQITYLHSQSIVLVNISTGGMFPRCDSLSLPSLALFKFMGDVAGDSWKFFLRVVQGGGGGFHHVHTHPPLQRKEKLKADCFALEAHLDDSVI